MATDLQVLRSLSDAVAEGRPVVLATVVATRRSVPRHAGAKMLVYDDGRMLGSIGGGAMESRVIAEAGTALRTGRPKLVDYELVDPGRGDPGVCGGHVQIYLEPFMPPTTIFVVGAGHVGKAVVELARWLGYRTVLTDDRTDQLEGVDGADDVLEGSIDAVLEGFEIDDRTAVVVVSRDLEIDVDAVAALIDSPARYLGVMGSSRRWNKVREALVGRGIDAAAIDARIHVPIGLDLGAETVEEIAVSIMAEVIGASPADD